MLSTKKSPAAALYEVGLSRSSRSRFNSSGGAVEKIDAGYTEEPHWGCSRTLQLPAFITFFYYRGTMGEKKGKEGRGQGDLSPGES